MFISSIERKGHDVARVLRLKPAQFITSNFQIWLPIHGEAGQTGRWDAGESKVGRAIGGE